jgi:hypothetical protein
LKKLNLPPTYWTIPRTAIIQRFGDVDADEICIKLDAIKQEPKKQVEKYFERLDKLFQRGKIKDVEQRRSFLTQLEPKLRRLYVVKTYIDIEEMVIVTTEIERVLGGLGETPYDPLKEEKDENAIGKSSTDKQLLMLNETLIHFFRGFGSRNGANASSFGSTSRCQLCQADDHTTVPIESTMKCGPNAANVVEDISLRIMA